jgi:hypothetical protein
MTRDDKINFGVRFGLIVLIYILAAFVEPCDNEPGGCHAPKEVIHE